jgi:hypothetical protein
VAVPVLLYKYESNQLPVLPEDRDRDLLTYAPSQERAPRIAPAAAGLCRTNPKSKIPNQKSQIKNQKSKIKNQKSQINNPCLRCRLPAVRSSGRRQRRQEQSHIAHRKS